MADDRNIIDDITETNKYDLESMLEDLTNEKLTQPILDSSDSYEDIREIDIKEYKYDVDIRKGINTPDTTKGSQIDFTYDNGEVRTVRQESGIGQFRQTFDFKDFLAGNSIKHNSF